MEAIARMSEAVKVSRKATHWKIITVGSRLVVLMTCNAVCWVPIVISILMLFDIELHEVILQWMMILVIPLGATLDPLMYNFQLFKDAFHRKQPQK